jgi:hypothetical protein
MAAFVEWLFEAYYPTILYNKRTKDETIISVIKRLLGEHITSRLAITQKKRIVV